MKKGRPGGGPGMKQPSGHTKVSPAAVRRHTTTTILAALLEYAQSSAQPQAAILRMQGVISSTLPAPLGAHVRLLQGHQCQALLGPPTCQGLWRQRYHQPDQLLRGWSKTALQRKQCMKISWLKPCNSDTHKLISNDKCTDHTVRV